NTATTTVLCARQKPRTRYCPPQREAVSAPGGARKNTGTTTLWSRKAKIVSLICQQSKLSYLLLRPLRTHGLNPRAPSPRCKCTWKDIGRTVQCTSSKASIGTIAVATSAVHAGAFPLYKSWFELLPTLILSSRKPIGLEDANSEEGSGLSPSHEQLDQGWQKKGERPRQKCSLDRSSSFCKNIAMHERKNMEKQSLSCNSSQEAYTTSPGMSAHGGTHGDKVLFEGTDCRSDQGVPMDIGHFKCPTCPDTFKWKHTLDMHMKIHIAARMRAEKDVHEGTHKDERHFKCSTCSKVFATRYNLKRHRMIHTGERPFKCSTCSKAFQFNSRLTAHQRLHAEERPVSRGSMNRLVMRKLTDERPLNCTIGHQGFQWNSHLTSHKRLHTDEKPFKCHSSPE
ncbi:unnamed protein product, partial [Ixodes hexagonus]